MIVLSIIRDGGGRISRKAITSSLRLFLPRFSVAFFLFVALLLVLFLCTASYLPASLSLFPFRRIYRPLLRTFRFRSLDPTTLIQLYCKTKETHTLLEENKHCHRNYESVIIVIVKIHELEFELVASCVVFAKFKSLRFPFIKLEKRT